MLLSACTVRCVWLVPYSSRCSAAEYCGRVVLLFVAGCVVCGVVRCVWCSCGGVSCVCSPLAVVVGGGVWMVGWHDEVGWHSNGRAGAVVLSLQSACWCPPCLVLASPSRLLGGRVEWRVWCMLWCPVFVLGPAPCVALLSLVLFCSLCVVCVVA